MLADTVMTTYSEGGVPICSATSGGMECNKRSYFLKYILHHMK